MTIGIDLFRDPGELHLHKMLVQPFIGGPGDGEVGTLAQVLIQLEGVVVTIVWAAVGTFIAGMIAKLVTGLRVSEEDDVTRLDIAEH